MSRARTLSAVALLGVAVAVFTVVDTNRTPPAAPPPIPTAQAPFASQVAGVGITEIGHGNVAVATPVAGVVTEIDVGVGDAVSAGEPLFRIDDRDLVATLPVQRAAVRQAQAALDKLRHRQGYVAHFSRLDPGAVSGQALSDLRDDVVAGESALATADAELGRTRAEIERRIVRAPEAGRILQVNVRVGEYAATSGLAAPLMLMGDDRRMFVRVDIDENDAWRVRPEAAARAFVRGNPTLSTPLRFEYIEPYVAPKTSLSGQGTERTDVRVLQVIYSFERRTLPVYVGQQMDVFIQAPPAAPPGRR